MTNLTPDMQRVMASLRSRLNKELRRAKWDFRSWHLADVDADAEHVRFRGQSGSKTLSVSNSTAILRHNPL